MNVQALLVLVMTVPGVAFAEPALRPYLHFHYGKAIYTLPDETSGLELDSPSEEPALGTGFGLEFGRHWAFEYSLDYVKTNLREADGSKAGDYSTATMLGQIMYRYPVWNDRLVPFAMVGGGVALGEFSGREDFAFDGGGSDYDALGVFGGGFDYFLVDSIALTAQAKYYFGLDPGIRFQGERPDLTNDAVVLTGGLRVYLDSLGTGDRARASRSDPGRDSDALRGYMALRAGKGYYTDRHTVPGITIERSSGALGNGALGVNFNRYLGAELAIEYARAQITSSTLGSVTGYPVYTGALLGRVRYPLFDDRLSPYVLAGGGIGFGETGDRDQPFSVTGFGGDNDMSGILVIGGGAEFFIEKNVAVGFEVKYTSLFETEVTVFGQPGTLSPDFVSVSGGIRIFYP
jgi:opacity protein-like surface antigen